jgi:hypothetical protein
MSITVKQLIKMLKKEDPNRLVVMASDSEGNSFTPLADISAGNYEETSEWSGEFGLSELTENDISRGYSDLDVIDGQPALCLMPTA